MKKLFSKIILKYYQNVRILIFKILSDNSNISGAPKTIQPVSFFGKGKIIFGNNVQLGYYPSPYFYDGCIHIEARSKDCEICFGNNIFVNNNFKIICDKTKIIIGDDVLIGYSVNMMDSDFHEISPLSRNSGNHTASEICIGRNVFIGSNVTILKGVSIGENSVIAMGSIVTKSFPENVIIGGNPAKIISQIIFNEQ